MERPHFVASLVLCGERAKFLGLGGNPWWWRVVCGLGWSLYKNGGLFISVMHWGFDRVEAKREASCPIFSTLFGGFKRSCWGFRKDLACRWKLLSIMLDVLMRGSMGDLLFGKM